ncbi:sugar ABC transporter substrate-binding protein [Nocardioides sp. GY 10127]|uniref:sugar ABC transporter substrate-binding protein n=1 Tax=Nocardioides sp. GY 10127 TaxID=2569762 RepID=UPI0010A8A945|nr:sugar ABC transporter substrate-binding protein [Nocardioides sp. GY 10127]TIC84423.1 extracellular solute-binding protein [Nocardioides sp. GY 10127]
MTTHRPTTPGTSPTQSPTKTTRSTSKSTSRNRRRTLVALTLAGLTLSSLAACGRDATSAGGEAQSDAIDDSPATGTIEVWAMGAEGEALDDFTQAFEKENPDADVEVTAIPWDSAHDKIQGAITSGQGPDVTLVGSTWMGEFGASGGLMPTPEGLVDSGDFFTGAWEGNQVGGTQYGVPWYVETRVLYYRSDLAKKAGWTSPPQTWDELKQFASDLQTKAGVDYGISLQPGQTGSWQTFLPFAWSDGAELANDDGTEWTLDSDAMKESLDYYSSFFTDGLAQTHVMDAGELESGFADGTYGSFVSGPWHAALVEDAGVDPSDYAVAPIPGPDGPGSSFVGGGNLAVLTDAENPDGAWKLVRWLEQPDVQQDFYDTVGDLPANSTAWKSGDLADDEQLAVFGDQLDRAVSPPAVPTWEQVADVIDGRVERTTKGLEDVDQAVEEMQSEASSVGTGL